MQVQKFEMETQDGWKFLVRDSGTGVYLRTKESDGDTNHMLFYYGEELDWLIDGLIKLREEG